MVGVGLGAVDGLEDGTFETDGWLVGSDEMDGAGDTVGAQ